jgi:hypothetical protein
MLLLSAGWKCGGYPTDPPPNASADACRGCHQLLGWGSRAGQAFTGQPSDHLDLRIRVDHRATPAALMHASQT